MRIGWLIYGSLENRSGGYFYDRKIVEHLRQQGDQVEILSLPWRNYARHLADNISPALYASQHRMQVDVWVQDELNHPSLFLANAFIRRRMFPPILTIVHHLRSSEPRPAWQNMFYRWVERRYLRSVDGMIFNSQTTRQTAVDLAGRIPPAVVAYPAADHLQPLPAEAEIRARVVQPGPLRLVFIGNLIPRKGLHDLVQALALLGSEALQLKLIGNPQADPRYTRRIRKQIEQAGLSSQIQFAGPLSQAELLECLGQSDVLVGPSTYEGFGIAYLEGMAFGLPAIASLSGAAWEFVRPGENGFLVPPGNPARLAQALRLFLDDRDLLLRCSLAARRTFNAHPTWEETGTRVRRFMLEEIV